MNAKTVTQVQDELAAAYIRLAHKDGRANRSRGYAIRRARAEFILMGFTDGAQIQEMIYDAVQMAELILNANNI